MQNNDKDPLVSVIMPCYNHEKYVGQAIESVLNQTYTNVEFIVCDNGSTDGSYEVIKQYEGKIDKILHLDKNDIEKAGTMLKEQCTGKYISFMTSDDFWEKQKLEKQMQVLKNNPQIKACFTWANEADENLVLQGEKELFIERNKSRYQWLKRLLIQGNCLAYPSAVVEREAYRDACSRLLPFYQLSDLYLWILILLKHDIYVVEEPLVWFRWHESGANHNMSAPNPEGLKRTVNETVFILEEIITQMDADVFKNTFEDRLRNKEASTKEEISCEKFFLLAELSRENRCYCQCAIDYYYRYNSAEFMKTLETKYHYTIKDFQEYCAQHGIAELLAEEKSLGEQKNIAAKQRSYITILQEVINADLEQPEQRKRMWRSGVFAILSEDQKEMAKLLIKCMNIVESVGIEKYTSILNVIWDMQKVFEILWNELLQWDKDISEQEWKVYTFVINKMNITKEEYEAAVFPFIQKVNIILKQYCEGPY